MRKLGGFILLGFMLMCGFSAFILAFSASRAIDTGAQIAAQELQRPPNASELIENSLEYRTRQEAGGGFWVGFGIFSLIASVAGYAIIYFRQRGEYIRQKRLTLRELRQSDQPVRRLPNIPSVTIPQSRRLMNGSNGDDHENDLY